MIQRIQTIYLMLVEVLFILLNFLPVLGMLLIGNEAAGPNWVPLYKMPLFFGLELGISVLGVATVTQFKKRLLQVKLCNTGMLISLLLFAAVAAFPKFFSGEMSETKVIHTTVFGFGAWLLALNPILFFMAARAIKKDEELVRSADRLR